MGYQSFLVHVDDSEQSERRLEVAAKLARSFHGGAGRRLPRTDARADAVHVRDASRLRRRASAARLAATRRRGGGALPRGGHARATGRHRVECAGGAADRRGDPARALRRHRQSSASRARDDAHAAFANELVHAVLMVAGASGARSCRTSASFPTIGAERADRVEGNARVGARGARRAALPQARAQGRRDVDPGAGRRRRARNAVRCGHRGACSRGTASRPRSGTKSPRTSTSATCCCRARRTSSADLIVMGAYSRPRLSECVLGGVTRLMLQAMTVPVLMSH